MITMLHGSSDDDAKCVGDWMNACTPPYPDYAKMLRLPGGFSYDNFRELVFALSSEHEMLRLRMVNEQGCIRYRFSDLDDLPTARFIVTPQVSIDDEYILNSLFQFTADSFDLPLARFVYIDSNEQDDNLLLMILDHAIYDGYGLHFLERQIRDIIAKINAGTPLVERKRFSYAEYVKRMHSYAVSEDAVHDAALYRSVPWSNAYRMLADYANAYPSDYLYRTESRELDADQTVGLQEASVKTYKSNMSEALIAASLVAMVRTFDVGNRPIPILWLVNDRIGIPGVFDRVNLSGTVGNFATTAAMLFDTSGSKDTRNVLRCVHDTIARMPKNGKTWHWLCRYQDVSSHRGYYVPRIQLNFTGTSTSTSHNDRDDVWSQVPRSESEQVWPGLQEKETEVRELVRWPEYTFEDLAPGRGYLCRLHFAEQECKYTGDRFFDIMINGKILFRRYDPIEQAGGRNRVIIFEDTVPADAAGNITINLISSLECLELAAVNAVEILESSSNRPFSSRDTGELRPVYQINCGGPEVPPFRADTWRHGGVSTPREGEVVFDDQQQPVPRELYQTECSSAVPNQYLYSIYASIIDNRLSISTLYNLARHKKATTSKFMDVLLESLSILCDQDQYHSLEE
jgi:predicted DNA-binding WGR domain protein